jgi:LmbE family N-acetylglucosaminyl deacetylase
MNVLVVAAHPDDELLGCGGTIVNLVRKGHNAQIAMLGRGHDIAETVLPPDVKMPLR